MMSGMVDMGTYASLSLVRLAICETNYWHNMTN